MTGQYYLAIAVTLVVLLAALFVLNLISKKKTGGVVIN